jgi:hypothetical protein
MDIAGFIGIILALFFGGLGVAYGGYSVKADYPMIAVLSYVFGGGCIAASIVLAFLRIDGKGKKPPKGDRVADTPLIIMDNGFLAWRESRLVQVVGKQYLNDVVTIDNTTFLNCTFEHVTFAFEGTGPFNMVDCQLIRRNPNQPNFILRSRNPIVIAALQLQIQIAQGTTGPISMRFEPGPP